MSTRLGSHEALAARTSGRDLVPDNPYARALEADDIDPNSSYAFILELAGDPATLLDVGCNTGYLGRRFLEGGTKVWGIDNDRAAVESAVAGGLAVAVVDLDLVPIGEAFPGQRFDTVVFADVLEHLKWPDRVLAASRELLTDDGLVVISMPNVAHGNVRLDLLLGRFGYTRIGLLDNTHLRFFTAESLDALVHGAGFEPKEVRRVRAPVDGHLIKEAVDALGLPGTASEFLGLLGSDGAETFQYVIAAKPPIGTGDGGQSIWLMGERAPSSAPPHYLAVEEVPNVVADMRGVITGLESSLAETGAMLDEVIRSKEAVVTGLESSLDETKTYLAAVIRDKDEVIRGLEASLSETRAYFEQSIAVRDERLGGLESLLAKTRRQLGDAERGFDEERRHRRLLTLPTVTVVVVNWNGAHLLPECLESLEGQSYPRERLQIVVVDNASTDGSAEFVRRRFPGVTLIEAGANIGFAAGNNLAISRSESEYVALLNNDAAADPRWLEELVAVAERDSTIGAVNSKIWLNEDRVAFDVAVSADFIPGEHDRRRLAARIAPVARVAGRDVAIEFERGAFAGEEDAWGPFRWLAREARLRVPIPDRSAREVQFRVLPATHPDGSRPTLTFSVETGTGFNVTAPSTAPADTRVPVPQAAILPVVQNAGSVLLPDGAGRDRGSFVVGTDVLYELDHGQFDQVDDVPAFCGAAVLLRRQALGAVGAFDPTFFMYYEDTDLSLRLRSAGWRIVVAPASTVRHRHAATSGEWSPRFCYFTERNRLLMLMKNGPPWRAAREWGRYSARLLRAGESRENRLRFLAVERSLLRRLPVVAMHHVRSHRVAEPMIRPLFLPGLEAGGAGEVDL